MAGGRWSGPPYQIGLPARENLKLDHLLNIEGQAIHGPSLETGSHLAVFTRKYGITITA